MTFKPYGLVRVEWPGKDIKGPRYPLRGWEKEFYTILYLKKWLRITAKYDMQRINSTTFYIYSSTSQP